MENRNGLIAAAMATAADGYAEREAALLMLQDKQRGSRRRITVGADKAYDARDFVPAARALNVTVHVTKDEKGRRSNLDRKTTRHPGYAISPEKSSIVGLIPTGFYPNSVSTSADGKLLYIVNGKSAAGPNPQNCHPLNSTETVSCYAANQYMYQITKAGFQVVPAPNDTELGELTRTVIFDNDHIRFRVTPEDSATMAALRTNIRHVIYIIKENRTYDQVLGDAPTGNGDPNLAQFPRELTPNFHKLAADFVNFDNFYDAAEVSGDGWQWSTSGRTNDTVEKEIPANYAGRGLSYNSEGTNRNINVGYGSLAEREKADPLGGSDPNLLPGTSDVASIDSDDGESTGIYGMGRSSPA